MREIRPSGSEGGETDSSVFPTPIREGLRQSRPSPLVPKQVGGVPKPATFVHIRPGMSPNTSHLGHVSRQTLQNKGCDGFVRSEWIEMSTDIGDRVWYFDERG